MLCRAARGGLLSRNALCRGPSIAPTANIPQPGPNPQPRRPVAPPALRRARGAGDSGAQVECGSAHSEATTGRGSPEPRAPGVAVRDAQQKCPSAPAGGCGRRGRRECGRARRGFGSESGGFGSRRSERSTSPLLQSPRGKSPKLARSWSPRVCHNAGSHPGAHFDVGGWGLAGRLWGASKGAAFRPVRASNLARKLRAGRCAADSHSLLARSLGGRRSAAGPRGDRACHRRGPGSTAPERAVPPLRRPGDLARPRAGFPSGPRGARVAVTKRNYLNK